MRVGANFLTQKEDGKVQANHSTIYQTLIEQGFLDTLKYPGRFCDLSSLFLFLDFVEKVGCDIDIHGLPGMLPATHDKRMLQNISWEELPEKLWKNPKFQRISTHIGLDNTDRVSNYSKEELERNFEENIQGLKEKLKEKTGREIEFGGENQPGGFAIDVETLSPEFISEVWGKMDFGIWDIAHAKNAAKDFGISYLEYLARVPQKECVKILHISGNVDQTGKYREKPDKHILTDVSEIEDIQKTMEAFPNLDLVVTEYCYASKFAYEKEIAIEIGTIATLAKTKDVKKAKNILQRLEQELVEDASNLEEVLEKIKEEENRR